MRLMMDVGVVRLHWDHVVRCLLFQAMGVERMWETLRPDWRQFSAVQSLATLLFCQECRYRWLHRSVVSCLFCSSSVSLCLSLLDIRWWINLRWWWWWYLEDMHRTMCGIWTLNQREWERDGEREFQWNMVSFHYSVWQLTCCHSNLGRQLKG